MHHTRGQLHRKSQAGYLLARPRMSGVVLFFIFKCSGESNLEMCMGMTLYQAIPCACKSERRNY